MKQIPLFSSHMTTYVSIASVSELCRNNQGLYIEKSLAQSTYNVCFFFFHKVLRTAFVYTPTGIQKDMATLEGR